MLGLPPTTEVNDRFQRHSYLSGLIGPHRNESVSMVMCRVLTS